jgi:hypothetical protein
MRLVRALRRKFGIAAPRLAVRTHVAWHWRWLLLATALAIGLSLAGRIYDVGLQFAGFERGEANQELARLAEQVAQLRSDAATQRAAVTAGERQLQIERVTQNDLAQHVRTLQDENARLKEDLGFFRSLMSAAGKEGGLSIYRFKVERDALPGEYRYRLLLLQSGQREREFRGSVQLLVNLLADGRRTVLTVPAAGAADQLRVNFKYYQRVEGLFQVAPGSAVKSVQVRIFEHGAAQPRLVQAIAVPS